MGLLLREPLPAEYDPTEFIHWFERTSRLKSPPVGDNLIEQGFIRACAGTDLNPFVIAIIAAVRTKWFTGLTNETDIFGFGFGGSIRDQAINALPRFAEFMTVDSLPVLTDSQKWQVTELYKKFVEYAERFPEGPAPMPEPPPPPPPPRPVPTPVEQPKPTPIPLPPPAVEPKKPFPWKGTVSVALAIMGAAGWAVKMLAPGWVGPIWDFVLAILKAILGLV
jgi:hypothetical protein